MDARAVARTLARVARTDFSFLADSSVRVVDDTTLEVRPAQMNRRLVEQLGHQIYDVVAPGSDPTSRPVCTGSFRLVDYVRKRLRSVHSSPQRLRYGTGHEGR